MQVTLILPRKHWDSAHECVEKICTQYGLTNLQCREPIHPQAKEVVRVHTDAVDSKAALHICRKLAPTFRVYLHHNPTHRCWQ